MKTLHGSLFLVAALTALAPATRAGELAAAEREALASRAAPELSAMRGGSAASVPTFSDEERATLSAAQRTAPDLAELRAGDVTLTERDVEVIGITLLFILVIAILV